MEMSTPENGKQKQSDRDGMVSLDSILSPDLAKKLYEITSGSENNKNKDQTKKNKLMETNPIPSLQEKENKTFTPKNSLKSLHSQHIIDKDTSSLQKKIDLILKESSCNYGTKNLDLKDDRLRIFNDQFLIDDNMFYEYDEDQVRNLRVLKYNEVVILTNCDTNAPLNAMTKSPSSLKTCGQKTSVGVKFQIIKPFVKLRRDIIKENDEILLYHCDTRCFLAIDENKTPILSETGTTFRIIGKNYKAESRMKDNHDRKKYIEEMTQINVKDVQHQISCSIFSSSDYLFQLIGSQYFLAVSSRHKLVLTLLDLVDHNLATFGKNHIWMVSRLFELNPKKQFLIQHSMISPKTSEVYSILTKSFEQQQIEVIHELLYALLGIEGQLFCLSRACKSEAMTFRSNVEVYDSLMLLATNILKIYSSYAFSKNSIERYAQASSGKIVLVFINSWKEKLQEYELLIARLEYKMKHELVTLITIQAELVALQKELEILCEVFKNMCSVKGGNAIKILEDHLDCVRYNHIQFNLLQAIKTRCENEYTLFITSWIGYGALDDKFNEFFVQDNREINKSSLRENFNSNYWSSKYTFRENMHVPRKFKDLKHQILQSGKYINLLHDIKPSMSEIVVKPTNNPDVGNKGSYKCILHHYTSASSSLLQHIHQDYRLLETFRALQKYMLLYNSNFYDDFFESVKDILGQDYDKLTEKVTVPTLNSKFANHIQLYMQDESKSNTPFVIDQKGENRFKLCLAKTTLIDHVNAIHSGRINPIFSKTPKIYELLYLTTAATWPTSLVISKQLITKYELMFRLILVLKYTQTSLLKRKTKNVRETVKFQYIQHFINNMMYYVLFEVIEIRFNEFQVRLKNASTIEDILKYSNDFLDCMLRECLLTHEVLLEKLFHVFEILLDSKSEEDISSISLFYKSLLEETKKQEHVYLSNLCNRLDFNEHFETSSPP